MGCVSHDTMGMHAINFKGSTNTHSFQKLIKNIKYVSEGLVSCFKLDYWVYFPQRFPGGFNLDLCVTRINKRENRYRKQTSPPIFMYLAVWKINLKNDGQDSCNKNATLPTTNQIACTFIWHPWKVNVLAMGTINVTHCYL